MSQAQYRRAAKPGGFQPINVGGQSIARMREESARVADGLRTARAAEIRDRETNLARMKEDARYTERAQAANAKILTQNATNELQQLQSDASVALKNFNNQQATAANVVKSVVGLSQTASKQLAKLEEERFKEDAQRAIAEFDPNSDAYIQHLRAEGQLDAIEELRQGAIDNVYANGGNPLAVAQAREMSSGARYGLDKARANYLWTVVYPDRIQRAKAENPEAFETSTATAAFLVESKRRFIEETGLINLKPEMMADGLTAVENFHQGILTQTRRVEEKNTYDRMDQNQVQILSQDPNNFNVNITKAFRTWARNPDNLFDGALKKFEGLATMRKPNGEFMFSMEQLAQAQLKEGGKAFIDENPGRYSAMNAARNESIITFKRTQNAIDDLAYQDKERQTLKFLAENNTQANANFAVDFFRQTFGKVPSSILTFQKNYTDDAVEKAKAIDDLKAIPDGFLTQEAVDKMAGLDFQEAKALEARLARQEAPYRIQIYKDTFESYKTIANGVTGVGAQKPNTPESVFLRTMLQGRFRMFYDEALEAGLQGQPAVTYAKDKVQALLDDARTNKKADFYRDIKGPGGVANFPNLNKGQVTKTEQALRERANLRALIHAKSISTVVNTKGTIIKSQAEADELDKAIRQPGFVLPGKFNIPTSMSKDGKWDPMQTINGQLAQWGKSPIPPPPSIDHVNQNVDPALRSLLYSNPSPNRSSRALGSANMFTPAIVPNNMGTVVQQVSQTNNINPSAVSALLEVHTGFDKDVEGGSQVYSTLVQKLGNPVNAAVAMMAKSNQYTPAQLLNKRQEFAKAYYKYGGGSDALVGTMRLGSPITTLVTGAGYTVEGFKDQQGRPVVLSQPALSGLALLIELSNGAVNPADITSSQRSHEHNIKVGGSSTSYHKEGTGRAIDIHGPSKEWMKANPQLAALAGWAPEPGYTGHGGHFVFN